ncbi:N-6 DNA methylase [Turicibacter bilis]|uniref:site-specific DNA-methyltransferase (adenine-specific) n=1 Tax=Turicibacter bilis TaxID=2735723 RepID=A0ABY5JKG0_9FIRM|nr:N-6 DNA methylase [Turicibacter bilis]MBS3199862.1 N-6 DNA methylase [Turicibacter bilis]UUF06729.1 N-6 DNA methylase [Turicibacter bilis]
MKNIQNYAYKFSDLLRGSFDSSSAGQLIRTFTFLHQLERELLEENEVFTSQLQGCFDLKEATCKDEMIQSLKSFIDQNAELNWLQDSFSDIDRLDNDKLFKQVIDFLNSVSFEQSSIEVFQKCSFYLSLQDRFSFETPASLALLSKELLTNTSFETLYDPAIGSGSLAYEVSQGHQDVLIYGQEINRQALNQCRMLLTLTGRIHELAYLKEGHTLIDPKHVEGTTLQKFDCIVCQPPFGLKDWGMEQVMDDARFHRGVPPRSSADFAFITQVVESLNETGKAVMIVPSGVLFRESREGDIRKQLIEENLVETVISLPGNMLYGTALPVNIVIFDKQKKTNDIFFMNATSFVEKNRTLNTLLEQSIKEIGQLYHTREERQEVSKLVSLEQVQENRYNLMVERYVTPKVKQEKFDVEALKAEHEKLNKQLMIIQHQLQEILG